ncbi:MAG: hypothetical protein IT462_09590 [Planctomycetes bacterium]|nr:hypothetical protein [Planctomycetota bacterium]
MPLLIDIGEHADLAKETAITYNTLSLLNTDKVLMAAARNLDLGDAEGVLKWFKAAPDQIKAVATAEAAVKAKADTETRLALAKTYDDAGRLSESMSTYEQVVKGMAKDDKRLFDIELRRAEIAEQTWDWEKSQALYAELFPKLLEAKDERAVRASWAIVNKLSGENKWKEAHDLILKVAAEFPKNDEAQQGKISAAWYLAQSGDKAGAKAELKAIISAGKEDDMLVIGAKSMLEMIEGEEGDKKEEKNG